MDYFWLMRFHKHNFLFKSYCSLNLLHMRKFYEMFIIAIHSQWQLPSMPCCFTNLSIKRMKEKWNPLTSTYHNYLHMTFFKCRKMCFASKIIFKCQTMFFSIVTKQRLGFLCWFPDMKLFRLKLVPQSSNINTESAITILIWWASKQITVAQTQ